MTTGEIRREALPPTYRLLGGRGLTSRIVCDEVDPNCDALGPSNKLVFAPGILSGTVLSSSSRISIGCKSPLTGGIKESNGGGETGLLLAQAGYRALIVEGAAAAGTWWILVVDQAGDLRLESAPGDIIGGMGNHAAADRLREIYGAHIGISLVGPAGEQLMGIAGIGNTDKEGRPGRMSARGAVGAVMGSKGLKAIVFQGDKRQPVPAQRPDVWRQAARQYNLGLRQSPATAAVFPEQGTLSVLSLVNKLGGLPTHNFSRGRFEGADALTGHSLREFVQKRGGQGQIGHSCMTGCAIRCSNVAADAEGREIASPIEYETVGLVGTNLDIGDFDPIARITYLCNDLGVDTIETGGALGVAMEAGLLAWGDAAAVQRILDVDVRHGTPQGKIIGAGAGVAGKVLGVKRVPVVKNQTISAYDPRAIKGNGVTYCTSSMGADHTAGNTIFFKLDHLDPQGKVEISRQIQVRVMIVDSLGFCNFMRSVFDGEYADSIVTLFNARTGSDYTLADLEAMALDSIRMEIAFNRAAGLGPGTDRLPEWMCTEALAPHNGVFDVPYSELDQIWAAD